MFFIHVPKTAGTSFRKAAEKYFGSSNVCYDYAPHSSETSDIIIESIYRQKDFLDFFYYCVKNNKRFLSGHVSANKYIDFFGCRNSVVFFRDPIQRIISEYHHFVRVNGYSGDFKSFYTKPHFIDRQKKILSGVPLTVLGFVGLTEKYLDSLHQINDRYEADIPNLELNRGRSSTDEEYSLDPDVLDELKRLNHDDIRLYQQCVELFEQRTRLWATGMPFVHAAIQNVNPKSLSGWAWWDKSDNAVVVEILFEGRVLGEAVAHDLRPGLLRFGLPRRGYVGFHFTYSSGLPVGSEVSCRVKETGQFIGTEQVRAPSA